MNVGGEYAGRAAYLVGAKGDGYGSPLFSNAGCWTETAPTTTVPAGTAAGSGYIPGALGSCTGDTRNLLEGTLGFWYTFYKGPKGQLPLRYAGLVHTAQHLEWRRRNVFPEWLRPVGSAGCVRTDVVHPRSVTTCRKFARGGGGLSV